MLFSHLSLGLRAALYGPLGHDALGGENPFCLGIRYENTPYSLSPLLPSFVFPQLNGPFNEGASWAVDVATPPNRRRSRPRVDGR